MKGAVTGGKVYGYSPIQINAPSALGVSVRAFTDHRIHPAEAEVVRGIFRMYLAGHGYDSIAKTLNGVHQEKYLACLIRYFDGKSAQAPRGALWAPSGIREMLRNERYAGTVIYGKYRNTYKNKRAKLRVRQEESEWIRVSRPDLRIVETELWEAVQKRLEAEAQVYRTQSAGLIDKQRHSHYLLSGLMICAECHSRMIAVRGSYGSGSTRRTVVSYMCGGYKKFGTAKCSNSLRKPIELFEEKILQVLKSEFLSPYAIDGLTREVSALLTKGSAPRRQTVENLQAEANKLTREIENLWALAAEGSEHTPAGLGLQIKQREEREHSLKTQMTKLNREKTLEPKDIGNLVETIRSILENTKALLEEGGDQGRKVLREFLGGLPIQCQPFNEESKKGYRLVLPFSFGAFISDPTIKRLASPRGFEPRLSP